ncbi:hypothetical protein D3C87_2038930 [compost metagenome]
MHTVIVIAAKNEHNVGIKFIELGNTRFISLPKRTVLLFFLHLHQRNMWYAGKVNP